MGKLLQMYEHEHVSVTFDVRRCIHAAECVRRLPSVFDPGARPWVRPERADADAIVDAVLHCPSGALRVALQGEPVEIDAEPVTVRVARHGPLLVRGEVQLVATDGTTTLLDRRVALCRCGQSRRKPLCDGSHREASFRDPSG